MKVSVIIPCYNEARTIRDVVECVKGADFGPGNTKEILVVDDGSTDGTRDILRELTEDIKKIFHEKNAGKGGALRSGIESSTGDVIVFQDADLELDPREYRETIEVLQNGGHDCVYGSRFLSRKNSKVSMKNYVVNKSLNMMFNVLYGSSVTDLETGHKAFRSDVIKSLNLNSSRFDIEVEITAKLCRRGINIHEVPVTYKPRTASQGKKMSYIKEGIRAGKAIVKYRFIN